ncbi:MAG: choice-of-anchor D domain-containing protein [Verrucomicrobiaceae bacterium]|nr:choice-of-anchor D domain-containing protein [Verrucomicrobiaceae bacterium]
MMNRLRLLAAIVAFPAAITPKAQAAPLSGTKSVGPTGDYVSLTAAIADVQVQTLGGALILELQPAYVGTVETFPLTIPALNGASAVNTLTIRPAAGATALSISSSDTTAATVDLNGAQYVTIDGRPGGVGSNAGSGGGAASQLTIANTSTSGVALRFVNDAGGNAIQYTAFQGVNTSSTSGVVVFSTTTGPSGNDNNTIDHCDIGDGASTPANCLYALGVTTTTAQNNSGNTVSNCNVFNFYSTTTNQSGVRLDGGNTDWTITGNSFYQTTSRVAVTANVRAIYLNNISGNNFTLTSNYIGGSAPNAGGTAWTTTGTTAAFLLQGIALNVGTTTPSSVQGNIIANFAWTSSSTATTLPGVWSGIWVQAGSANLGTVTGNTIGSGIGTGSISVTTSGSGGTTFGTGSSSSGMVAITNNTIGSITVNGSASSISASLTGIQVTSGMTTISNNIVGSTGTPSPLTSNLNSLNAATPSTSTTGQQVTGILSSSTTSASITGNTVANLTNNYVGAATTGQIRGIVTSAGVNTVTSNAVRNLFTTSQNTQRGSASQSVIGISSSSTAAGQIVSQNSVHSLANTADSAGVGVAGIYFTGSTSGANTIARNWVHSLVVSSTSNNSEIDGMDFANGVFTAYNNMVRVGLKADGTSTPDAPSVFGIYDLGSTAGRSFYHNSVYIGGTRSSGGTGTYAFVSSGSGNARAFQNNLFINAHSSFGGTGKHYAVSYFGPNLTGLTAGGNILLASGSGGVLGYYNGNRATHAAWQTATGQDASSVVADPRFNNPTGDAATVDLHLQPSNPAESQGVPIPTVADDFDGQTRADTTPVDIGADAGDFTWIDGSGPEISYTPLSSGSAVNRVLTGWATFTDNSGSVSGGANAPRLYFKKSTDADVFGVVNDSIGNGWKYVIASGSGPFGFTLDYSLIYGGSVSVGDTVQYFVVAQDAANNLVSSPALATASANPPVQNVNGHGALNSFSIVPLLSGGTKTVGSGGDYPNLSGAGGLFAAINGVALTGNVIVTITSDTTENGSTSLIEYASNNYPPHTLTLQPDSATMRTIYGNVNSSLITLNGADRVTIDGRFAGSGRYLTFRNANTGSTASTIEFINDASSNTVRNCVVEGAGTNTSFGVISFSAGTLTGNDNNLITGCQVRNLTSAVFFPWYLIRSAGSSTAVANSGNTVSSNELFNFDRAGVYIHSTGNDSWTLSDNDIYEVNATSSSPNGISMQGGGTNLFTGNYIHDLLTTSGSTGIYFSISGGITTVARNRITALNVNTAATAVYGILAQGSTGSTLNVVNNQITLSPATSGSRTLYGLYDTGSTGGVVNAFYNSILIGGIESGARSSWASYRNVASTHTARNNLFLNLRAAGTGSHFATGNEVTGGSYTVSNNVYSGTGATAANFMDFSGTFNTPVPMSFAAWQISTGDANSQAGIAGTGGFTSAMFVNAAAGDLHLVPGGDVLVNDLGIPVPGVTDDFDGDLRPTGVPTTIGSDQLPFAAINVAQVGALADGAGSVDFGNVTLGGSGAKTFTITNPGTAALASLAITKDGAQSADFTVGGLSATTVPAGGGSASFTVTFTPSAAGARGAVIHIASNVAGTKNPFDIALIGNGQTIFAAWAAANGVSSDPAANNGENLIRFACDAPASGNRALVYAGNGVIGATGLPVTRNEAGSMLALFVRRKDRAAAGLIYTPQFNLAMQGNAWEDSTDTPTVLADDGTDEIVAVPYPISAVAKGFFRLRVTLSP